LHEHPEPDSVGEVRSDPSARRRDGRCDDGQS
jgi:hypothetical protein